MESSENENVMISDGENEIGINEWNMEDEMLNGSFQINLLPGLVWRSSL
jgi:hypothetical protein